MCVLLAESAQLGWLSRGDSFGEAALVNPSQQRPVSVVAGDEGVMLLVLDRACFSRLQQQAQEGQPLAAAAVQALLAAACRPLLRVGGRGRTAEEVQTLAELFSGLEVRASFLLCLYTEPGLRASRQALPAAVAKRLQHAAGLRALSQHSQQCTD
jgi:CRP-like cAMP-binding protein